MAKSNRSKWQMGEQKQRFAIRKFSQGVFSVLVGTMFVFGTPAVIQGDEIAGTHIGTKKKEQYQIKFQHVTENSLTSEQRAKVIYDNPPKTKVGSDQVYYLVYRPVATQNLPQTGELEMPWELGLFGATDSRSLMKYMIDDMWTPEKGNSAKAPAISFTNKVNNYRDSDLWLRDASYLRLKNVEIGYNFPKKILSKINIGSLRVFATGYNLLTLDKLKIVDPESRPNGNAMYPVVMVINMGLKVGF